MFDADSDFTCKLLMSIFLPLLSETSATESLVIECVQIILSLKVFLSIFRLTKLPSIDTPLELRKSLRLEGNCHP